jgi:transcription elongation factor GreB
MGTWRVAGERSKRACAVAFGVQAMSKAFTKDDGVGERALTREPPQIAPGEKRYATAEGYRALQNDLARLTSERPDDPRVYLLRKTLAVLTVPPAVVAPTGRVFFGAWVVLEDEEGETRSYRIVGPDEADAKSGLVSVESPLARALLGKEEGETVAVDRPRGRTEFTIMRVSYGPD